MPGGQEDMSSKSQISGHPVYKKHGDDILPWLVTYRIVLSLYNGRGRIIIRHSGSVCREGKSMI